MKQRTNTGVAVLSLLSLAVAALIAVVWWTRDEPMQTLPWACLPVLVIVVAAAERFQLEIRGPASPARFTLVTATIAPLVYGYGVAVVVAAVAVGHIPALFDRNQPRLRALSLMARWSLVAALGASVADALGMEARLTARGVAVIALALAVIALSSYLWVQLEAAVSDRVAWPYVVRQPVVLAALGLVHWVVNTLFGLLFVFALAGTPLAVLLLPMPLLLILWTARLYTGAFEDRGRVETLSEASRVLSDPVDPMTAVRPFLEEIRGRFAARTAALVILNDEGRSSAFRSSTDGSYDDDAPVGPLERRLLRRGSLARARAGDNTALARLLREDERESCLAAPMTAGSRMVGMIVLYDVRGPSPRAARYQVSVLETLARQTAHTLTRGWAIAKVLENERSMAELLDSTSDGIFTVEASGKVSTWNPACERITGLPAAEALGRRDVLPRVKARTAAGAPVDLADWQQLTSFPREMVVTSTDGERRLACSFTRAETSEHTPRLVVVARDITPATAFHELREQFTELVEMQAAQRLVVDHLQQAVAPEPPAIDGVEIAVTYVPSDPTAPTGGDLFDWHELPTGEVHVAVVDVLGHGVTATRDALTVIHTLRYVAVEGTELKDLVARADELLGAQDSDLVATVVVARLDPRTGELRVASGGHPPAIVTGPGGEVRQVGGSGGAIGWPGVGSSVVGVTRLVAGESLVLYTDGLVEARRDIIAGMAQLETIAGEVAGLPAQQLADVLVDRSLEGAERHDDALALVLRLSLRRQWDLAPHATDRLGGVRSDLRRWLRQHELVPDDVLLVADELLANALAVARTRAELVVDISGGDVLVQASDDGGGHPELDLQGRNPPPEGRERGRGLFIVRQLAAAVDVTSSPSGSVVRARVRAARRAGSDLVV